MELNRECKRVVKNQYQVRKVSIDDLVYDSSIKEWVLPADTDMNSRTVSMSENRLFRWYHESRTESIDGVDFLRNYVTDFLIFSAVSMGFNSS